MKKYLLFLLAAILPALGSERNSLRASPVRSGRSSRAIRFPTSAFARCGSSPAEPTCAATANWSRPSKSLSCRKDRQGAHDRNGGRAATPADQKGAKAYIRGVYRQIKEEYTPVVRHMTRTQGKVLLKLIDRETDYTAYEVLREFRGGFVAGFWQTLSRVFGQDLKSEYDAEGDDRLLEQIVRYYEAGLL